MIVKVFSAYDSKAQAYMAPFFQVSVGTGMRLFGDAVNDPNTCFYKHAGDYVLYQIADFDDSTGEFRSVHPAVHLGIGSDFVQKPNPVSLPAGISPMAVAEAVNGSH